MSLWKSIISNQEFPKQLRGSDNSHLSYTLFIQESNQTKKFLITIHMEGPPPNSIPCSRIPKIQPGWTLTMLIYTTQEQYIDICQNLGFLIFEVSKPVKSLLSLPLNYCMETSYIVIVDGISSLMRPCYAAYSKFMTL